MRREKPHRLGDLQLSIMQALWDLGPATVAQVQEQLGVQLAYTTVATMLRKMEARGLVRHEEQGRKFVYEAAMSADEVAHSMSRDLVDRVFSGSLAATVNHLLEDREISADELDRLERLIQRHKRGENGGNGR